MKLPHESVFFFFKAIAGVANLFTSFLRFTWLQKSHALDYCMKKIYAILYNHDWPTIFTDVKSLEERAEFYL